MFIDIKEAKQFNSITKMRLYINDGFCDTIERLKRYITLIDDRSIREDLLDVARSGDLSLWLKEHSHIKLAEGLNQLNSDESIDGDAEYITRLSALFEIENKYEKTPYHKCLKYEDVSTVVRKDTLYIRVRFQILDDVNETYRIFVISRMENLFHDINPSQHAIGTSYEVVLTQTGYNPYIEQKYSIFIEDSELKKFNLGGSNEKWNPLNMIKVVGGRYQMGATYEQGNDASENEVKRSVTVHDFFIATVPVTRCLWNSVMEQNSSQGEEDKRPKTNVSYDDCQQFIKKLNQMTGEKYRLPTEEEWEFAARGGKSSKHYKYSGGNNISEVSWYRENDNTVTLNEVGKKKPNELGIYDMSGNVWEWTSSPCSDFSKRGKSNKSKHMVTRGGCANSTDKGCRVSRRYSSAICHKSKYLGFRLAK